MTLFSSATMQFPLKEKKYNAFAEPVTFDWYPSLFNQCVPRVFLDNVRIFQILAGLFGDEGEMCHIEKQDNLRMHKTDRE